MPEGIKFDSKGTWTTARAYKYLASRFGWTEITGWGKFHDDLKNQRVWMAEDFAATQRGFKEDRARRNREAAQQQASIKAAVEAAFDAMVATTVNPGQAAMLESIRGPWVEQMSTAPLDSFQTYLTKWNSRMAGGG